MRCFLLNFIVFYFEGEVYRVNMKGQEMNKSEMHHVKDTKNKKFFKKEKKN